MGDRSPWRKSVIKRFGEITISELVGFVELFGFVGFFGFVEFVGFVEMLSVAKRARIKERRYIYKQSLQPGRADQ